MQQSEQNPYLILTSDYSLDILRQAGLLQELDKSLLPNYENLNPLYLNQYFDPDNQYVIPYVAGCPLIVYDPERVPFEITGYEDLWNESLTDSVCLFCFEGNVRYAAILGYVGAGGLGLILNEKIGWREYDSVGMILVVLFGTVLVIEALSHYIRKKLT